MEAGEYQQGIFWNRETNNGLEGGAFWQMIGV